jgi:hypothetical protein
MAWAGLWLIGYGGDAASGQSVRGRAGVAALPADVVAFRERRDRCDHLRGEEPGDEARAVELEKALHLTCHGTDAQLSHLRRKYRRNAAVVATLRRYENRIE